MITQATPPCVVGKWFGAIHHMFTPLLVPDFQFCPKRSVLPDFLHPPPFAGRGVLEPFLHPFCTLCALEPPFCTISAGGFLRQGFLQEGHQIHPPGSNLVSQAYMQCLFLRSFVASPKVKLCRAARCRNPTSRASTFTTWVRPRRETRGRRRHHPRMLLLKASLKGVCLCCAGILLNT